MNQKVNKVEDFFNNEINKNEIILVAEIHKEFKKYCKLYEKKRDHIAESNLSKKQTIDVTQTFLEKDNRLLYKLLYSICNNDMKKGVLC